MVIAFLVSSCASTSSEPKLEYRRFYRWVDSNTGLERDGDSRQNSLVHDSEAIVRKVTSSYHFRVKSTGRTSQDDLHRLNSEDTLPEFERGIFRYRCELNSPTRTEFMLGSSELVDIPTEQAAEPKEVAVLWLAAANCCFTLLLEQHENVVAAEAILKSVIRSLQEHTLCLNKPSDLGMKVERVEVVLNHWLPSGTLLFATHRLGKSIDKNIENQMKQL